MSGKPNKKLYPQANGWLIERDEKRFPRLSKEEAEDIVIRYRLTPPVTHPKYKQWENGIVQAVTVVEVRQEGEGWYVHPGSSTDHIDIQEAHSRAATLHIAANEAEILQERDDNKLDRIPVDRDDANEIAAQKALQED